MAKTTHLFVVLSLSAAVVVSANAQAPAPVTKPATVEAARTFKAVGVISKVDDGEVVLSLVVTNEQRAAMLKLPNLDNGMPASPGRVGAFKGELFVRYVLANDELEKSATENMGRKVICELDAERRVTGIVRATR